MPRGAGFSPHPGLVGGEWSIYMARQSEAGIEATEQKPRQIRSGGDTWQAVSVPISDQRKKSMKSQNGSIDHLISDASNARRNDAAIHLMCGSIGEFLFGITCLTRGDGEREAARQLIRRASHEIHSPDVLVIVSEGWAR